MEQPHSPILFYNETSATSLTYCTLLQHQFTKSTIFKLKTSSITLELNEKTPWIGFFSIITLGTIDRLDKFLSLVATYQGAIVIGAIGTSPPRQGFEEELTARHLGYEQRSRIKIFYLQGGYNQYQLGFVQRFSLSLSAWKDLIQIWKKTPSESSRRQEPLEISEWKNTGKSLSIPKHELLTPMVQWLTSIGVIALGEDSSQEN